MKTKYGLYTATSIVVANMIGTGVFTSLGFQVIDLSSGFTILLLWFIGGLAALLGALSYAELGAAMPRSGGEYHFLSVIYRPFLGFLSGWVSFLVGFAAPIAAAAIAFGTYFSRSLGLAEGGEKWLAIGVILLLTLLHAADKKAGAVFQNLFTTLKIIVIIALIAIGFIFGTRQPVDFGINMQAINDFLSPAFAIGLFFVSYSYSGWNAAAYIAGEIERPEKNIPRSLIFGTLIVTILYLLLNFVFLYTIPMGEMAGKIEIGYLFGNKILGEAAGQIMGLIFTFLLLSTVSSMIITGPRVTQVLGSDYSFFKWFSDKNKKDIPVKAILIQSAIAIIYVITSTFDQVITYIGFTLNLFTMLTVIGLIVYREQHPETKRPYKVPLYPVIPILFIIINLWILVYGLIYKPYESIAGLITSLSGLIIFFISKRSTNTTQEN